jgi:hypothetical protein
MPQGTTKSEANDMSFTRHLVLPLTGISPTFGLGLLLAATSWAESTILIEAESFAERGGWVIDQQAMDQMGSPYLLAHGLGQPVAQAETKVEFPEAGTYQVWVRTRDWVAPWKRPGLSPAMRAEGFPGRFRLRVNGTLLGTTFGTEGADWHWQSGGSVGISKGEVRLALEDLTGFDGRCDALLFSTDPNLVPPNNDPGMAVWRRALLGFPEEPPVAGPYDFVVVGGGMAGICAAISAARQGCHVALIQNRPVLGGNNSSEVRVGLSGLIFQEPHPKLGSLVDEIGPVGHWNLWEANRNPDTPRSRRILEVIRQHPEKRQHNAGPASNYEDTRKLEAVRAEPNLDLFLCTHVNGVEMAGSRITAVVGQDIRTGERWTFRGSLFSDCTGDGTLGFLAGADFRQGRESVAETGESLAPEEGDQLAMGTSVQWYAEKRDHPTDFPLTPWAVQFTAENCSQTTRGDWDWETGARRDQVREIERIRDYALRVTYGNWSVLKNAPQLMQRYQNWELQWVAYIGGKRESRRLLGDVILRQQDIVEGRPFADACVTTTWTIDLHYPKEPMCACDAFQSEARHLKITPYPIPYRCLYSRNIDNLMMAGRNISVTHVALGTVRVQRTTGMMGEVLGMAASLCARHACDPRGVYEEHLAEFQSLLKRGVPGPALTTTE